MNERKIRSQERFPFQDRNLYTSTTSFKIQDTIVGRENKQIYNDENERIYKAITSINNRLDDLENENRQLHKELSDTKKRENKLLNRFSCLIQIINIGSVILIIIAIILFIDSFYPFIKKLMDNSVGATIVVGTIGATISSGIIAIWLKFNKYVKEVIERENKQ